MSVIYDDSENSFALIESNNWSESYFSTVIQKFANKLFPSYHCFPFEHDLYYIDKKVRPDLILIEKNFKDWWLVEVELERHSWVLHIRDQIEKISGADITLNHVSKLEKYSNVIDLNRLKQLMLNDKHKTLIIVDSPPRNWMDQVQNTDARLMTIQVYRNNLNNKHIVRCDTFLPNTGNEIISYLKPTEDNLFKNYLEISSPHRIDPNLRNIAIRAGDEHYECRILQIGHQTYLVPPSRFQFIPTNPANRLALVQDTFVTHLGYFGYTLKGKVVEIE